MKRAIREHLRDFLAILFLLAMAAGVGSYILSNQRFSAPAWVPFIGADPYTIEVELATAQAVTPGQGQTVNIAGVKVGDIARVELDDGVAVVTADLEREYEGRVFRDATVLLRPRTGLKDMYLQLTPGDPGAGRLPEGGRIPVANTLPDVNADEILAQLDGDTRDYLRLLLNAGAEAFRAGEGSQAPPVHAAGEAGLRLAPDRDTPRLRPVSDVGRSAASDLRQTFRRFEPTGRDLATLTRALARRRRNLRRVIHNFQLLSTELAGRDRELAQLVDSSAAVFRSFANSDRGLRETVRLLPGTLADTERTLASAERFGTELGPALDRLGPFARNLGPALRETRPFLRETTPVIRDQLRPFSRDVRPTIRRLRPAARDLASLTPDLRRSFTVLNKLLNALAYNPPGDEEEGYLFWASWLNHAGAQVFSPQDAHGVIRRGLFLASCNSLDVLDDVAATNDSLRVLTQLLAARPPEQCPPRPSVPRLGAPGAGAATGAGTTGGGTTTTGGGR